jgi:hypothetical protein
MKYHPTATVTDNAKNARNITRKIIGRGCDYADGRVGGVRYKWMFNRNMPATSLLQQSIVDALYNANIENWRVVKHVNKYGHADAISVTILK